MKSLQIYLLCNSFLSVSFTHLNPSNSLRSNYQTHRLYQNSNHCNFFPINFKNMFGKKELSVHIERKRIWHKKSINELV